MEYVDLLPDSTREKQLWRARLVKWGFVAFGFVLLVIGYSFVAGMQVAAIRQELLPLEREVADKDELNQELDRLEQELERTVEKQGTLKEVVDQRAWAHAFADIASAAKGNAWLEQTRFTKVKIRMKSDSSDGSDDDEQEEVEEIVKIRLTARGYADTNFDLANFMARLQNSRYFEDVELNYSQLTKVDKRERLIQFEIEGTFL
jgi:Tfp pilus assembly protein PilN